MSFGDGRRVLEEVFEPLPEGVNNLPCFVVPNMGLMGVLVLWDREYKGVGNVELAIVDTILPRHGWNAPFLHRSDDRSELCARLLDVEERTGRAFLKTSHAPEVVLSPCHFVCRVQVEKDGKNFRLSSDGLERLKVMRWYLSERNAHQQSQDKLQAAAEAAATKVGEIAASTSAELCKLPSPSRAS